MSHLIFILLEDHQANFNLLTKNSLIKINYLNNQINNLTKQINNKPNKSLLIIILCMQLLNHKKWLNNKLNSIVLL